MAKIVKGEPATYRYLTVSGRQSCEKENAILAERARARNQGFGNELASEAEPNTLPVGQNNPQQVAHGCAARARPRQPR